MSDMDDRSCLFSVLLRSGITLCARRTMEREISEMAQQLKFHVSLMFYITRAL